MQHPLTSDDILAGARELVPEIRRRAHEIAQLRQLPRDLVEKLRAAGCFRLTMPKSWGGPEMSYRQQIELMELLGEADTSVSWCVKIGSDSGIFASLLEEGAARALYPHVDIISGGQAPPNGRAVKVSGGYSVSGRWGFASGCTHADVMVGGCVVTDGAAASRPTGFRLMMAPASAWHVEDTWHSLGLAGSGSHHFSAKDLIIPEAHALALTPSNWCKGPLYVLPVRPAVFVPMAGTPLGLARHAIDTVCKLASEKIMTAPPPPRPMKDVPRVRTALALAETQYGAARAFVYDSVDRLWAALEANGEASTKLRRDVALARTNAFQMAKEVTRNLFDLVGAQAVYQSFPLEGMMRDAATMRQHNGFSDDIVEQIGGTLLGIDAPGAPL